MADESGSSGEYKKYKSRQRESNNLQSGCRFIHAWRVALRITALNIRARLEYRANFLMTVGSGIVGQASILLFVSVLLTRFPGLGGWSSDGAMLIASMRLLSHGLFVLFFGRVVWLPSLVQEGWIDGFLLRPMPVYRQVQLAFFNINAIGDLLAAATLFTAVMWRSGLDWTPARIGYLVAAIIGGTLMEAAMMTTLSSAAFRFPSISYWMTWLEELLSSFGNYPLNILPGTVSLLFIFVIPIAFIAYFPAALLTGNGAGISMMEILAAAAPFIGLAAFLASRRLWDWSLRHYTGING